MVTIEPLEFTPQQSRRILVHLCKVRGHVHVDSGHESHRSTQESSQCPVPCTASIALHGHFEADRDPATTVVKKVFAVGIFFIH